MIKMTNGQASAFNSPIMVNLFADKDRVFPVEVAFKLGDLMQQISARSKAYADTFTELAEKHQGKIDQKTGQVTYPSQANQDAASKDIEKLNEVEIEFPFEKLKITEGWPKLTLAEAAILKPITEV